MSGRIGFRIAAVLLLGLLLIGGAAALGYMAYSAGVSEGTAQAAGPSAPPGPVGPMPYYGFMPYRYHPYGFGFLGCLAPLFFLFIVFFAFRLLFGGMGWRRHGGPWGWHGGPFGSEEMRRHWMEKAEQWHREQHGEGGGAAKA